MILRNLKNTLMHTFHQIWIHAIWSVKHRYPYLKRPLRYRLFQYIRKKANEKEYTIDMINGVSDHVHCLLCLKPSVLLSKMIKDIKGSSSRWINEQNLEEGYFAWQVGYAAISVSPYNVQKVRNYIKNQEIHHKEMSFEEEIKKMKLMFLE